MEPKIFLIDEYSNKFVITVSQYLLKHSALMKFLCRQYMHFEGSTIIWDEHTPINIPLHSREYIEVLRRINTRKLYIVNTPEYMRDIRALEYLQCKYFVLQTVHITDNLNFLNEVSKLFTFKISYSGTGQNNIILGKNVQEFSSWINSRFEFLTILANSRMNIVQVSNIQSLGKVSINEGSIISKIYLNKCGRLCCLDIGPNCAFGQFECVGENLLTEINIPYGTLTNSFDFSKSNNLETVTVDRSTIDIFRVVSCGSLIALNIFDSKIVSINCSNSTLLREINISELSNIRYMACNNCTNLSVIRIPNNSDIQHVQCNGCTCLEQIILSKNNMLFELTCDNSAITVLDLSMCVNLSRFSASFCKNLVSIRLPKHNFKEINCKNCERLEILDMPENISIMSLDVSKCSKLRPFDYKNIIDLNVSFCDFLTTLNISNSEVRTVVCRSCVNLQCIVISETCNRFKMLNCEGCNNLAIVHIFPRSIKHISCSYCNELVDFFINSHEIRLKLNHCAKLKHIHPEILTNSSHISCRCCKSLETIEFLPNAVLQYFDCSGCSLRELIVPENCRFNSFKCSSCFLLETLMFNNCRFTGCLRCNNCTSLERIILQNCSLWSLICDQCSSLIEIDFETCENTHVLRCRHCRNLSELKLGPINGKIILNGCRSLLTLPIHSGSNITFLECSQCILLDVSFPTYSNTHGI